MVFELLLERLAEVVRAVDHHGTLAGFDGSHHLGDRHQRRLRELQLWLARDRFQFELRVVDSSAEEVLEQFGLVVLLLLGSRRGEANDGGCA